MTFSKWHISYNYQKEPDYINTYFYEFDDTTANRMSFKELYQLFGNDCSKYIELESSKLEAYFYIDDNYDMNKLTAYDYLYFTKENI